MLIRLKRPPGFWPLMAILLGYVWPCSPWALISHRAPQLFEVRLDPGKSRLKVQPKTAQESESANLLFPAFPSPHESSVMHHHGWGSQLACLKFLVIPLPYCVSCQGSAFGPAPEEGQADAWPARFSSEALEAGCSSGASRDGVSLPAQPRTQEGQAQCETEDTGPTGEEERQAAKTFVSSALGSFPAFRPSPSGTRQPQSARDREGIRIEVTQLEIKQKETGE